MELASASHKHRPFLNNAFFSRRRPCWVRVPQESIYRIQIVTTKATRATLRWPGVCYVAECEACVMIHRRACGGGGGDLPFNPSRRGQGDTPAEGPPSCAWRSTSRNARGDVLAFTAFPGESGADPAQIRSNNPNERHSKGIRRTGVVGIEEVAAERTQPQPRITPDTPHQRA
jgi:hypothetical protein